MNGEEIYDIRIVSSLLKREPGLRWIEINVGMTPLLSLPFHL
jgi:hypothetical protein